MSEKPQRQPDVSEENVSRETSELTPEQVMLNEILDRAMAKSQTAPEKDGEQKSPPQEETPAPKKEEASPSPPEKNKPSSAYIYLAVLFGAAFLMLLLAYFVQQRNNATVQEDLRITTASREELLEDIKALEKERDQLQKEVEYQKSRVAQVTEERDNYQMSMEYANSRASDEQILNHTLKYFWYITQFMEHKEYPMAAAAMAFSAEYCRRTWNQQISVNPAQVEQYEAYRQELIDRGYLEERPTNSTLSSQPPTKLQFTQTWDPSQSDDVATLCILWCALDEHFVEQNDQAAVHHLSLHPLGDPESGYQERVERLASQFTLEQFQIMKDDLTGNKWLVIAEDGAISEGPGPDELKLDILYNLPFDLPTLDPKTVRVPIN